MGSQNFKLLILMILIAFISLSCGGGGGGDDDDDTPIVTINGLAAAGAPIIGTVNVRGANGNTSFSSIEADGSFTVDVSALTAPFVVWVEGSANGKGVKLYSTISDPGTVNVTPVTNAILAMALNNDPEEYFETGSPPPPSDTDLDLAKQAIFYLLESAFDSLGMPEDFDLMNGEFIADGTGFDKILDTVSLPVDDDTIEIVDNSTGTTLYEEVLSTGEVTEEKTPEEVEDIIGSSLSLLEEMGADMQSIVDLYADEIPTLIDLGFYIHNKG